MQHDLKKELEDKLDGSLLSNTVYCGEITIETNPSYAHALFKVLKNDPAFQFDMLMDVCGVDYLDYGVFEWETERATETGFSRGVEKGIEEAIDTIDKTKRPRYAVVYHLLSISLNQRLRVRVILDESMLVDSVADIWSSASWFEREAYDMYGILFKNHSDLRRILTDYGFVGHPFRKDFPVSGYVEMRYDATVGRVIYEPVDIQPRTLVPKVGRKAIKDEEPTSHGN